jgi:hypothetical protein
MTGMLVGIPLAAYVFVWLHGVREVAALIGGGVGLAIALVVGTRSDPHDDAANAAWREAAPDLPPVSDRIVLEGVQASMPGPTRNRRTSARSTDQDAGASSSRAAGDSADPH